MFFTGASFGRKIKGNFTKNDVCVCVCENVAIGGRSSISHPESSGSLASGWSPGETLVYWNFITAGFLR